MVNDMSMRDIAEREREAFETSVAKQEAAMADGCFRSGPAESMAGLPPVDARPLLRQGDVTATLFNELGTIFRRIQMADAFEKKVTEAAKSPAAWLLLREELNGGKDVTP